MFAWFVMCVVCASWIYAYLKFLEILFIEFMLCLLFMARFSGEDDTGVLATVFLLHMPRSYVSKSPVKPLPKHARVWILLVMGERHAERWLALANVNEMRRLGIRRQIQFSKLIQIFPINSFSIQFLFHFSFAF